MPENQEIDFLDVGDKPDNVCTVDLLKPSDGYIEQSAELSLSKIIEDRSLARIITSKLSVGDNNSQFSVPLGFVNPEGDADKDINRKNWETAKNDQQKTQAIDQQEEEQPNL